ncbi:MAG: hypothetical protein EOM05_01215 [Clostridia bacterium]|nr:hypothetical protein [Clostridia bacterium]
MGIAFYFTIEYYIERIKQQLPAHFLVIVAEDEKAFNEFMKKEGYKKRGFIEGLLKVVNQYGEIMANPFNIDDFKEDEVNVELLNGQIISSSKKGEENYFKNALLKIPSFSSFEKYLDTSNTELRAEIVKNEIFEKLYNNEDLKKPFMKLRMTDSVLFTNVVNSTSSALLIGLCLELSNDELINLAIISLFEYVGNAEFLKTDINFCTFKKGEENENHKEQIELFLKTALEIESLRQDNIIQAVMDRYEKFDGTGFPNGKKGKEINLFSRIISICHDYEKLVNCNLGQSLTPMQAMVKIWEDSGKKYDSDIVKMFFYRTNVFKVGKKVFTDDGKTGTIVGFKDFVNAPAYPIIKIDK